MTAEKRAKTDEDTDTTPAAFLKEVWKNCQALADKLFIIKRPNDTNRSNSVSWYLVQVDLEETNNRQAKTSREHHLKYYLRNVMDAKKKIVRNCRHWPLIRAIKQPRGEFEDIIVLRPKKVDETLAKKPYTRGWYQGTVNLVERVLVGPFNFSIDPPGQISHPSGYMDSTRREKPSRVRKSGHRRPQPNHTTTMKTMTAIFPKQQHEYRITSDKSIITSDDYYTITSDKWIHKYTSKSAITIRSRHCKNFSTLFLIDTSVLQFRLSEDRGMVWQDFNTLTRFPFVGSGDELVHHLKEIGNLRFNT